MIAVRSLEDSTGRYLRNSIRAYFEGESGCDLRWISGVVRSSPGLARAILESRFAQYASTERYRDLITRLCHLFCVAHATIE